MKKFSLFVLAGILAALLAAIIGLKALSNRQPQYSLCARGAAQRAALLEITPPGGETARFVKTASGWAMMQPFGYPANAQDIAMTAQMLCGAEVSDVLSTSPDAAAAFGLNPENAVKLAFYGTDKKRILEITAGKESASLDAFYGRNDAGEVREISGIARAALARPYTEWLDKTVCRIAAGAAASFEWKRGREKWKAVRSAGKWFMEHKGKRSGITGKAQADKISALEAMLANLQAEKVVPAAGKGSDTAPFKPDFSLEITAAGSNPVLLTVDSGKSAARRLRLSGETRVEFILSGWRADSLLITP
ncbi:MAG: DUF4340 domain-containing protein [Elusimicrobiales bacterium]|nr:DUF4340 domain-containing protein [Elusimicrobiales bacterium]